MGRLEQFHRRLVLAGPESGLERLFFAVLVGLSWIYGGVVFLRDFFYRVGFLPVYKARIPVIAVGNLSAGGTGKTPFVDFLLGWFTTQGISTAVVSRGYGGSFTGKVGVVSTGNGPQMIASVCGDEPYLLSFKHPQTLVYIAPRRRDALKLLELEQGVDVVLLDDAFQHRQVDRDLDIVLLDAALPLGNGRLLPAGLLREKKSALSRADLLVLTRTNRERPEMFATDLPVCRSTHRLADRVTCLEGEPTTLQALVGQRCLAFAGIAAPEQFYRALVEAGVSLQTTCSFTDHYVYTQQTVQQLEEKAAEADFLITTEKDAVKLTGLSWRKPCYVTQLELDFWDDAPLFDQLQGIVKKVNHEKHQ